MTNPELEMIKCKKSLDVDFLQFWTFSAFQSYYCKQIFFYISDFFLSVMSKHMLHYYTKVGKYIEYLYVLEAKVLSTNMNVQCFGSFCQGSMPSQSRGFQCTMIAFFALAFAFLHPCRDWTTGIYEFCAVHW